MALDIFRKPVFDPETEIPSLADKVILITGGTGGLGRETVISFAKHNAGCILFTGRSQTSADETIRLTNAINATTSATFVKCALSAKPPRT
ncbi:Putative polyketide synthase, ketoreductase domain, NAD(P)-binding domain superfamily [Septoria linicola]|uniref:Polyketide synthase, ketoreductase domain, NAD(P)-binding domain superfamily n=1 Tax=Septoria linicola TaxID=215465 RepID=A0A9Q9AX01_9PEZI|nr:putative polyketide synthase, ketoreductase domain, NAD(P)-binding domain superfamily [Septoria linicola]USW52196.1 Putative polyketide synthase, ketoreductase domain, NAD(P)-binding domain superfamily [Septoria linicola]